MYLIEFESDKTSVEWLRCVEIVKSQYKKVYNAEIEVVADTFAMLINKTDHKKEILSCIGYKFYSPIRPFSTECYLEDSLENIIENIVGDEFTPRNIVEVGSMASIGHREGVDLIRQLPQLTNLLNRKAAIVTITKQIKFILDKINIPYYEIGVASLNKIANPNSWGSYYEQSPICILILTSEALKNCKTKDTVLKKLELELI